AQHPDLCACGSSRSVQEHCEREATGPIPERADQVQTFALRQKDWIVYLHFDCKLLNFSSLIDGDAYNFYPFVCIRSARCDQKWDFLEARCTPSGPEVCYDDLAAPLDQGPRRALKIDEPGILQRIDFGTAPENS